MEAVSRPFRAFSSQRKKKEKAHDPTHLVRLEYLSGVRIFIGPQTPS
jgi:hypothetical protein